MSIHIHAPIGHYIGQVRSAGFRRWKTVTKRCKTAESATSKAALKLQGMKRARVLFICDWYDPIQIMEAVR